MKLCRYHGDAHKLETFHVDFLVSDLAVHCSLLGIVAQHLTTSLIMGTYFSILRNVFTPIAHERNVPFYVIHHVHNYFSRSRYFPVAKVFIFKTNKVVSSLSPLFQSMSYVFIASMRDLSLIAAH